MVDRRSQLFNVDVVEQTLPGIGRRYEMVTTEGDEIVVVIHNSGRRDCYVLPHHRGATRAAVTLTDAQARTLGAVMSGAYFSPKVVDQVDAVLGDLLIDWVTVHPDSPGAGRTIGELEIRERTAMTVAAIVRGEESTVMPGPDARIEPDDLLVVLGRQEDMGRFLDHVVGRHG
jgi:TrkA domain protein